MAFFSGFMNPYGYLYIRYLHYFKYKNLIPVRILNKLDLVVNTDNPSTPMLGQPSKIPWKKAREKEWEREKLHQTILRSDLLKRTEGAGHLSIENSTWYMQVKARKRAGGMMTQYHLL